MNDEQLRAAYWRLLDTVRPRSDCPTGDVLLATLQHRGPETTRLRALDHAASCAECLRDLELLRAVTAVEPARARPPAGARWRVGVPLALAAALVVALSLNSNLRERRQPDTPRGEMPAVTLVAPADGAGILTSAVAFIWHPVSGARRYTVEVMTTDGVLAMRAETTDTTLLTARALPTGEYRWWVRAQSADGTERRSATRLLRVRTP